MLSTITFALQFEDKPKMAIYTESWVILFYSQLFIRKTKHAEGIAHTKLTHKGIEKGVVLFLGKKRYSFSIKLRLREHFFFICT